MALSAEHQFTFRPIPQLPILQSRRLAHPADASVPFLWQDATIVGVRGWWPHGHMYADFPPRYSLLQRAGYL
jgi:hypothetical protein